jgi:hypothetical protein
MADINYESSILKDSSRPQTGAHLSASESLNNLNSHEQAKMQRILEQDYNKRQYTILDMPLGKVINNTVNFFGNSYDIYTSKQMEAELSKPLYSTENEILHKVQLNLLAIIYFIRDEDNIIYLGIIMIIFAVLLCFFNISRGNGNTTNATISETITK